MEWYHSTFEEPVNVALQKASLIGRPRASAGTWFSFLLPCAVVLGSIRTPEAQEQYHVAAIIATGMFGAAAAMLLHLLQSARSEKTAVRAFSVLYFVPAALTTLLLLVSSERGIAFSLVGGLVSTFPFCIGVHILMQLLPGSFSYGEASCITQALVLFLFSSFTNLSVRISDAHLDAMEKSTVILQVGLLGLAIVGICVTIFPNLRETRPFCAIMVGVMGGAVVPILYIIMHENPILWIIHFILDDLQRVYFIVYWMVCTGVAIMAVCTQVQDKHQASTAVRKTFHLLVLAVYLPGIAWECTLMHLSSGIAFAALILTEMVRLMQVGTLGERLQQGFLVFADEKDVAGIALTPIYLLLGCSAPLWLHPARCALRANVALPMMSGLLSVGAGDTAASIVGSAYGTHKWPGSMKSKEGTIACIVAQLCVIAVLIYLGFLPLTMYTVLRATFAIIAISLAEALMDQVDNLVLPLLMYILLV